MTQLSSFRTRSAATLAAVGVASLVAACGSSGHSSNSASASGTPASDHTVQVALSHGHLTGPGDRAIYLWDADHHDKSVCHGACAAAWPPVLSKSKPRAGRGVKGSDLSTIARPGGQRQVAYNGHPLYYYAGDSRGTTRGQGNDGFGARWWLVSSSGSSITSHSSASKAYGSSGSGGSGGSGSGGGW